MFLITATTSYCGQLMVRHTTTLWMLSAFTILQVGITRDYVVLLDKY